MWKIDMGTTESMEVDEKVGGDKEILAFKIKNKTNGLH
jgi:hypothetical protein